MIQDKDLNRHLSKDNGWYWHARLTEVLSRDRITLEDLFNEAKELPSAKVTKGNIQNFLSAYKISVLSVDRNNVPVDEPYVWHVVREVISDRLNLYNHSRSESESKSQSESKQHSLDEERDERASRKSMIAAKSLEADAAKEQGSTRSLKPKYMNRRR